MAEQDKEARQRELAELAEREFRLRKAEFDALVAKAGIDDAELARLRVLAALIADAQYERSSESSNGESSTPRRSTAARESASSEESQRRTFRKI